MVYSRTKKPIDMITRKIVYLEFVDTSREREKTITTIIETVRIIIRHLIN